MGTTPRRIVVAISGASGAAYGIRLLEVLRDRPDVETHLIVSGGAVTTIHHETNTKVRDVEALADVVHDDADLAASIASGSFRVAGMAIAPCSIKVLSAVANCYGDSLIARAADVRLKERQPLVLLVRETPLHRGHLRLCTLANDAGAIIMPPVPALYMRASTIAQVIDHSIMRVCDQLGIATDLSPRWAGLDPDGAPLPDADA